MYKREQTLSYARALPSIHLFSLLLNGGQLGKVRFFLGGGRRAGEFRYFFSNKSVSPPLRFNEKTPDPPPLGD